MLLKDETLHRQLHGDHIGRGSRVTNDHFYRLLLLYSGRYYSEFTTSTSVEVPGIPNTSNPAPHKVTFWSRFVDNW